MKGYAFLFDLDGVIFDTEGQYTVFWDKIGADYLGDPALAAKLKGETIATSLMKCFPGDECKQEEVRINGLYLAGGGAKMNGLSDYLQRGLRIPVRIDSEPDTAMVRNLARLISDEKYSGVLRQVGK